MSIESQNYADNIDVLIARHLLVKKIERWQMVQIVVVVLIPSIFAITIIFAPALLSWGALLPMAVEVIDPLVMGRKIKSLTLMQARIAELFDCEVFGLPWDRFVAGDRPPNIEVQELIAENEIPIDAANFQDWYPVHNGLNRFQQIILAQESTIAYDMLLRKYYSLMLTMFSIAFFTVIFTLGFVQNLNIQEFALLLAPLIPISGWLTREFIRTREAEAKNADLHMLIREERTTVSSASDKDAMDVLRGIQTAVYLRRAKHGWVPEMFYRRRRDRLERMMNKAASSIAKELTAGPRIPAGTGTPPQAD